MPYIITAEILIVNTIIVTMYCYYVVIVLQFILTGKAVPERGRCFFLPKDCFVIRHGGFLAMIYHSTVLSDTNEE